MNTEQRDMNRIEIGRFVGRDKYGSSEGFFAVNISKGGMSLLRVPGQNKRMETGLDGEFVPVEETVESFESILKGELDEVPEQAFLNVGGIEQVLAKAKALQES